MFIFNMDIFGADFSWLLQFFNYYTKKCVKVIKNKINTSKLIVLNLELTKMMGEFVCSVIALQKLTRLSKKKCKRGAITTANSIQGICGNTMSHLWAPTFLIIKQKREQGILFHFPFILKHNPIRWIIFAVNFRQLGWPIRKERCWKLSGCANIRLN